MPAKGSTKSKASKTGVTKEEREKRAAAREQARKDAIESGALILNGKVEFHRVEDAKAGKLEKQATEVLKRLEKSSKPLTKQELADKSVTSTGMFAMLKAQGLVIEYRARAGGRRGSEIAYLHRDRA